MTTILKPILPALDIDRDLFGRPVTRSLDDRQLLDQAIDGLRDLVLDEWRHSSDDALGDYFHDELGGAEGAISEFGYHFDVLEREEMQALAVAQLDIAMKAEIEFWADQQ